jgi:hypothetical protein
MQGGSLKCVYRIAIGVSFYPVLEHELLGAYWALGELENIAEIFDSRYCILLTYP